MRLPLGIILAGGQARRMGGGDKALLVLGGQTLLARGIARLRPQVGALAVNANGDAGRFADFGLPVLADSIGGFAGPLAGVLAGLDWAAQLGADHVVTTAVDTPFFPADLVVKLQMAATGQHLPIALAATPHPKKGLMRQPTFGLWPVSLRDDLRQALTDGVRKIVQFTDAHGTAVAAFDGLDPDPFFNVNTPADMARADSMLDVDVP
jgi:molybdenum cofactor guanylyltransferase